MKNPIIIVLILAASFSTMRTVVVADEAAAGLREGWKWRATIPAFKHIHAITFPVMIDDGQTINRYGVSALPSCFLIDQSGKVVWGLGMAPPSEARIEELLK